MYRNGLHKIQLANENILHISEDVFMIDGVPAASSKILELLTDPHCVEGQEREFGHFHFHFETLQILR